MEKQPHHERYNHDVDSSKKRVIRRCGVHQPDRLNLITQEIDDPGSEANAQIQLRHVVHRPMKQ